ncbi:hypothetical protein CUMW_202540 [Citrus unshiu]|uniref:C2H2-type domain-containing protein n=2 Tax=Citrus TaxID=2706 RepID=A0A067EJK2_CITSI|nr:hypothetical protein CISIN_1g046939mg [Citrus sinensis]GAY60511.1 hypothetical protein CUMW_202540 [Citrus unshiu]
MSGNGHPDGFSLAPPPHRSNSNPVQEHCAVCQQVFFSPEALINHYQTHIRGEELMNFQNNFIRVRNQAALEAQRLFGFDIPRQNQHLHPPSFSLPPIAMRRIQSFPPPTNDGTVISAARARAAVANQLNQPAAAAIPNQIDLNSDYNEENNNPSDGIDDGSINLDLTLGR